MNIANRSRDNRPDPALRRERAIEALDSKGGDWRSSHEPGTHGCFSLPDRVALIANNLDDWVLSDPACLMNPGWSADAASVLDALWDLDHEIGDAQLDGEDRPWSRRDLQGNPS